MSRYSEAVGYTNIDGNMGESKVSINDILLENIDKEILINFILSCNTCQRHSLY